MALRVLVADPSPAGRESLELALVGLGCEVFCAVDAVRAQAAAEVSGPDVVLWALPEDTTAPGPATLARSTPGAYLVALASDASDPAVASAVERGFGDFLALPCSDADLRALLHRASRWCRAQRELRLLRREVERVGGDRPIVAASPRMIALLEAMERASGFSSHLLLRGEPGTGKEGLARAIHAQSQRRAGPFVAMRCRAPAEGNAPPEIAARLVDAHGGILFLDDLDALHADLQDVLLSVLECEEVTAAPGEKPRRVDVRIIGATFRDLRALAAAGEFHPDLCERIAGLELEVPALRDRTQDVPLLVDHFLARASRELGKAPRSLSDDALERLVDYAWPGNVRELENVVERAVMLAHGERVTGRELPERLEGEEIREGDLGLRRARKRLEVEMIRRALRRTGGNRTHAAKLLEISHRALLYKLKEYGI